MLRTRLYLGLLPLLLLFIIVGLAATLISRDVAQSIEKNLVANYRAMIGSYEMREAATLMTGAIYSAQRGDPLVASKTFEEHRSHFQRFFMEQSLSSAGTERTAVLEDVDEAFTKLSKHGETVLRRGGPATPDAIQRTTEASLFGTLKALERLTESDFKEVQRAAARAQRLVQLSINFLAAAMIGGILLSLFLSYRLARSLLKPIQALTTSAVALGEGNLDRDVPITSRDELGELARTFNTMAAKLRAYRDAMNERVTRARRTMEATLASTPDPLFVVDREGRVEVRNPAGESLGASPEFVEGFPPSLKERVSEVLATGQHYLPTDYDHVITTRRESEERHYLPRILAIGDDLTGFGGAAVILQDVTKFRLLDDVKSNLVSTVSHELKTPLTSLRLAVYLLLEQNFGKLNDKQRDLLETARDDADRLLKLLNSLLDLSRLEGGVSQLNRREVPVRGLLDDMAREMKALTEAADQRIEVRSDVTLAEVSVDPDRIRHVFINLLANASKYSGPDTVITLYAEDAPDGFVRFGVRDQGPGIPEESVPFIFEKFYRVPGQTVKGAGLGLTIAREIVVAHGGSITCSSEPGQGSDFYFLLPQAA